jgi:hypothetical protein
VDTRVKQKLTDIFVRNPRCFLQQLLDRRAGAHVDAFGFGMHNSGHKASFLVTRWIISSGHGTDNLFFMKAGAAKNGFPCSISFAKRLRLAPAFS